MTDPLVAAVHDLLTDAADQVLDGESRARLDEARHRLHEPLRLAFAGRVKAGKSTLLNALVGEELAPTDASECTRVVTWYVGADRPEAVLHRRDGSRESRPYRRDGGPVDVDLGCPLDEVDHLEIRWPSARLRQMTLIDTPGTGSLSTDVSRRAEVLLPTAAARQDGRDGDPLQGGVDLDPTGVPRDGPDRDVPDDRPPVADAVLYLLRHVHVGDVRFLEAFQDDDFGRRTSVNTLGVLSRADEIGSCRLDALDVAARIADRYEHDPRMHRLCPVVVPVAGLVAQAGVTLREDEYRALARLAAAPSAVLRRVLLTADRLTRDDRDLEVPAREREHLLARLGLFGVRLGVDLVRRGEVRSASDLAAELSRRGGLEQLRGVVLTQFGERARLLTCRSAVTTLRGVLARRGVADPEHLEARLEGVLAGAHGFVEVKVLDDLRSGDVDVPEHLLAEMERLLGGEGTSATARLGLADTADGEEVRAAALAALARWRRVAESPLSSRSLSVAARTVVRSCEGVLADLPAAMP